MWKLKLLHTAVAKILSQTIDIDLLSIVFQFCILGNREEAVVCNPPAFPCNIKVIRYQTKLALN